MTMALDWRGEIWSDADISALSTRLKRFAYRLFAREPVVEPDDLVQETFSRILGSDFENDGRSAWSFAAKTMKRIWLDALRRPGRFVALDEAPERTFRPPQEARIYVSQLVAAFDGLTPDRKVVAQLLLDGEEKDDIKITLGKGNAAVSFLLKELRADLRAQGFDDEEVNRVRGIERVSRQWRFRVRNAEGKVIGHKSFPSYSAAAAAKRLMEADILREKGGAYES